MNDAQLIERLAETDAYAPDRPLPEAVWSRRSALTAIERRIGPMQTQPETETRRPESRRPGWRRPLAAAAAAFVVVAAAIGAVAWVNSARQGDAAEGVAAVEALIDAINAGETDLSGLVTEEAIFAPMTVPLNDDLAAFWAGLDTTIVLSGCEQVAATVECDYVWTDRIREAQQRPVVGSLTFLVEDGAVGAMNQSWDEEASGWVEDGPDGGDPVIDYLKWVDVVHPGFLGEPGTVGLGFAPLNHSEPVKDAAYADLLTRYVDEYAADLAATGGFPEDWKIDRWQQLRGN